MLNLDTHILIFMLDGNLNAREHELIAATSIVEGIPLLTRDHRILTSKLVPFA
jgi:PIN domain nuclease of toxin-antitoxin system